MNKTLQEHIKEAVFAVEQEGILLPLVLEKFAELIVRECAKVLNQHGAYFSGNGEPYHYAAGIIKQHFGIEE